MINDSGAEGLFCGSTSHEHKGCVYAERDQLRAECEELRAENERLREALGKIAKDCRPSLTGVGAFPAPRLLHNAIHIAQQALAAKGETK